MAETFNFNFFQIPATGVDEPELDLQTRTTVGTQIRRQVDSKFSNFGASNVDARDTKDYTRTVLTFKSKDELADWATLTADTGIGANVKNYNLPVNYNPLLVGSTVKYARDDQFIRMTMSRNTGSSLTATQVDLPKFDIMDTKSATAEGILLTTNYKVKNWPTEGWYSFGKKHDFVQNQAK